MRSATWANKPNACFLGSYRIATAPEPYSSRLTSLKSIYFDSPANNVGPENSGTFTNIDLHRSNSARVLELNALTRNQKHPRRQKDPVDGSHDRHGSQ
jgi:hypothetical protein